DGASSEETIAAAGAALREAVEHAETPLQEIARAAGAPHGTGSALVQVLFTVQRPLGEEAVAPLIDSSGGGEARLGAATLRRVRLPEDTAQVPLALEAWPRRDGSARIVLRYDT